MQRILARALLAAYEQEPVATMHRLVNKRSGQVHPWVYTAGVITESEGDIFMVEVKALYAHPAPPIPAAVPDERTQANAPEVHEISEGVCRLGLQGTYGVYAFGWNACRAAMLQAEPVNYPSSNQASADAAVGGEIKQPASNVCWCHTCRPATIGDMRIIVCPDCGNKRCPKANDYRNACSGSNEPGQEGSAYPAAIEKK